MGSEMCIRDRVAKMADVEMSIKNDINQLTEALASVRGLIKMLDDEKLQLILFKRYLNYQRWEVIAADLGYSYRRVTQMHGEALVKIAKIS